jgi:serine/threonine protein kinase
MSQVSASEPTAHRAYLKSPGDEPLPGYVLIEPLGRGGFGEVWKCEAPGGLLKAIKFVAGEAKSGTDGKAQLRQEFEAFQQVKLIRHPFLLSLERVELVGDQLVMVMELADRQLGDRFNECRRQGFPGIPREELLSYLREAAEALDVINAKFGLQHLDVKPGNLFLTGGHVQVGDYGLVSKSTDGKKGTSRGLTPRYAAPEVLCGEVHTRSDQYSLALVYHELLTGTFPYAGETAQQLMLQHVTVAPDLRALPPLDRIVVGTALAKKPEERFASCLEFVQALITGLLPPTSGSSNGETSDASGNVAGPQTRAFSDPGEFTHPSYGPGRFPPGTGRRRRPVPGRAPGPPPVPAYPPGGDTSLSAGFSMPMVRLESIFSVVPVPWLLGKEASRSALLPDDAVASVVRAAAGGRAMPGALGPILQQEDGTWACRFLTTIDPRLCQVKLDLLWEERGVKAESPQPGVVVVRNIAPTPAPSGLFAFGKKPKPGESGFEITVRFPEPGFGTGEVTVTGHLFGMPTAEFVRTAEQEIVALMEGVRLKLNTIPERRKHPRIRASFPLMVFPIYGDGRVELPVNGTCKDVSAGGIALMIPTAPPTKYLFVAFAGVPELEGMAILVQVVRSQQQENEVALSARYRLDVGADGVGR